MCSTNVVSQHIFKYICINTFMIQFNLYIHTYKPIKTMCVIIVAVTEGLVREEQLLHDMCLLSATTVEITQILTRAGPKGLKYI
jgi:hypothetical protein